MLKSLSVLEVGSISTGRPPTLAAGPLTCGSGAGLVRGASGFTTLGLGEGAEVGAGLGDDVGVGVGLVKGVGVGAGEAP